MNMIEVLWDVDPRDWEVQNKEKVVNKVMTDVKDGDIILLHDGYDSSMLVAFEIIDRLQAQGYEFVTVDKLIFELPWEKRMFQWIFCVFSLENREKIPE